MNKIDQNPKIERSEELVLSKTWRLIIHVVVVLIFLWLFISGWINLWNRGALPSPISNRPVIEWGGWSVCSIFAAVLGGYVFSWVLIWQLEIILYRIRLRRRSSTGKQ